MTETVEADRRLALNKRLRIGLRSALAANAKDARDTYAVRWLALLAVVSLAVAVAGRQTSIEALSLIGAYGVIFLGIGSAPFQLITRLDVYARLTCAILVGFSVLLGVGAVMGDVHGLWRPWPAAAIVGVAAALLHLVGLRRARVVKPSDGEPTPERPPNLEEQEKSKKKRKREAAQAMAGPADSTAGSAEAVATSPDATTGSAQAAPSKRRKRLPRAIRLSLLVTTLGTALWLLPALLVSDHDPGFWGMLKTIGPAWYVGLVLLLAGFVIGRRNELSAAFSAFSFALATTLTPALVYGAPRNQTAEKQMQLTRYVMEHHHIDVTAGIYQAFSSMFAAFAWLSELLHIHGTLGAHSLFGVATYWPVLVALTRVITLRFLAGRVLPTAGRRWTAVMLVLLVDSLGNDYFSPQSIGYVMAIGAVGVAMNGIQPRPLGRYATIALLTLVGVTLAPTHELSPYMAAGALFVLAVFDQAPRWSFLPIAVPALLWAGLVHKAVGQHFTFGALFNVGNFRPPVTIATLGLERLPIVGYQSHALLLSLLVLMILGAVGFFTNVRSKWAWAYALCPVVGLAFIAINPYGNEGIFRATLFAIPWMAILAMKMRLPERLSQYRLGFLMRPGFVTAGLAICTAGLLALFLVAAYAMDGTNVLSRNDVAVSNYVSHLPPSDAFVLSIGSGDNPTDAVNFTADYTPLTWDQVATEPEFQSLNPTALDLVALTDKFGLVVDQQFGATNSSPLYLVWSGSSAMYSDAYGLQSPRQMDKWLHLLQRSPQWELVDHSGDTYLFRLLQEPSRNR